MNKPLVTLLSVCLMGLGSVALAEDNAMTNDQGHGSMGMNKTDTMGKDTKKSEDNMMKEPPSAGMAKDTTMKKETMKKDAMKKGTIEAKKHAKKMSKEKDSMSHDSMQKPMQ